MSAAAPIRYRLLSKDKKEFRMNEKALRLSTTLSNLIDNLDYTPERIETSDPIPVEKVGSESLKLVIEWCEHYENNPIMVATAINKGFPDRRIPEWDGNFLQMRNMALFRLMHAADYLDIQGLTAVTCKFVAAMATGKGPEELRELFGLPKRGAADA